MEYIIISVSALAVSALTLFSGFGLGTLLMPVFALFFSPELAIAATAVVHLANNIFKLILVGRRANFKIVAKFAIPAAIFAIFGALLLNFISDQAPLFTYSIGIKVFSVTLSKLVIAALILFFALNELIPTLKKIELNQKFIPLGGVLSGFFGGLSGLQGALRTAFLIRLGLSKEVFIGTVVVSAVIVDVSRLTVYGLTFFSKHFETLQNSGIMNLVIVGIIAAFIGSFVGRQLLKKITMKTIQLMVGVLLLILSILLGTGLA